MAMASGLPSHLGIRFANFESAGVACLIGELRNVLFRSSLLQQINPRALLAADSAAELGNEKSRLQCLRESPPGFETPLPRQRRIFLFDDADIAGDFDRDPLAKHGSRQIGSRRLALGVELDQGL